MKKTLNILKNIFTWAVAAIALCMMIFTIVSVTTFNRTDRSLFGYKVFIVASDSMSKTDFNLGDIIFVKKVDPATLKEGDIISYVSQNSESFGQTITHKIRKPVKDANGNPGFVTYGTTTDTDDEKVVTYPYVIGKYVGNVPNIGKFFQFLKTTPGYIICILIPFLLLILFQGLNCIKLFRRYKQEQLDEMQSEKEKIEAERLENQKLMQELLALKQQLEEKENSIETSSKVEELN